MIGLFLLCLALVVAAAVIVTRSVTRPLGGLAEVAGNPNDSFWTWRDLMYRMVGKISPDQLQIIARQL